MARFNGIKVLNLFAKKFTDSKIFNVLYNKNLDFYWVDKMHLKKHYFLIFFSILSLYILACLRIRCDIFINDRAVYCGLTLASDDRIFINSCVRIK